MKVIGGGGGGESFVFYSRKIVWGYVLIKMNICVILMLLLVKCSGVI